MLDKNIIISQETFPIVEYKGVPVVTLAMIDKMHGRKQGTAGSNFKANKARFQEEKHYHLVDFSKKEEFLPFGMNIPPRGLIVLTERGYLLLAKSLTDDLSWDVQEKLIDGYFRSNNNSTQLQHAAPMAIGEKRTRCFWMVTDGQGHILANLELMNGADVSSQVEKYFPEATLVRRADMLDFMDEAIHTVWEMDKRLQGVFATMRRAMDANIA